MLGSAGHGGGHSEPLRQDTKGYFPQDDTGLIYGSTRASPDISFEAMAKLQQRALENRLADPAVDGVGSSVGASGFNARSIKPDVHQMKPLMSRGRCHHAARYGSAAPLSGAR